MGFSLLPSWDFLGYVKFCSSHAESWNGIMGPRRYVTVWGAAPACLMSCIWGERNHHTFKDSESTVPSLKFSYLKILQMGIDVLYSLNIFLDGVSRDSTFVLLILQLVSCFSFFFPCIAVFYELYSLSVHFLIFNKLQLLIQKGFLNPSSN